MLEIVLDLPRRIWGQAWLLLMFTAAIWGGNAVAARMATGEISPMCLVFLRWLIVCAILWLGLHRPLVRDRHQLLYLRKRLLALGFAGFTGFSALFYLAAYQTSAVNITLLQSAMPPLVLLGALVIYKERVRFMQMLGMALALIGIVVVASHGDLANLSSLSFNIGDIAILIACVFYAGYTLALRRRPAVPALVFFFGLAIAALITSIPFLVIEVIAGYAYWPSLKGFAILIFVALGPSLSAQLAYMRGIELIGPGRAGLFPSLVPAFGALFAVVILGEPFALYHAIALALGLGGVYLAETKGRLFKPIESPKAVLR